MSLTPELFNSLLAWLSDDEDEAGARFEEIRRMLIIMFTQRRCQFPDELADKTIDRVAGKVKEVAPTYVGDPALYFYGVAKRIFLESLHTKPLPDIPAPQIRDEEQEEWLECLDKCLEHLSADDRRMVLEYYRHDKREKIANRISLAQEFGLGQNALRIRTCRTRSRVQKCLTQCVGAN